MAKRNGAFAGRVGLSGCYVREAAVRAESSAGKAFHDAISSSHFYYPIIGIFVIFAACNSRIVSPIIPYSGITDHLNILV